MKFDLQDRIARLEHVIELRDTLGQVKLDQALSVINQMTALFRMHVRERDMDDADLKKLIEAEKFASESPRRATVYEGAVVTVEGEPVMEPNDVTEMLDMAISAGMWIRVQDPDSHIISNVGYFDYGQWTNSAESAWKQIVRMVMSVDEDFLVQFKKEGEEVREGHIHWVQIVGTGGNTPDHGWLCDGCTCDSMDSFL